MTEIIVRREAEDRQSREVWSFRTAAHLWSNVALVLQSYGIERRSEKGRYRKMEAADRWICSDERRYVSGLPRPTAIPDDVISEAMSKVEIGVFVGFLNEASRLSPQPTRKDRA